MSSVEDGGTAPREPSPPWRPPEEDPDQPPLLVDEDEPPDPAAADEALWFDGGAG